MEALTLSRKDYDEGLDKAAQSISASGQTYAEQFSVTFPDGLNNPSALEVCRIIQNADLESKIRLTKIMIADKNVEVHCPNGDVEKFHLSNPTDSLDAFDLFKKEPLALLAISDAVYGYILKKSLRLSASQAVVAETESKKQE